MSTSASTEPDSVIRYLPSLLQTPIQFYSCFVSYSTKDQDFADRLSTDLQNTGVRCWFAKHDIQGGKKIHEQIDEAIRNYDRLLLILSDASMNSEWVKTELRKAVPKERREGKRVLFPIALVPFQGHPSLGVLRRRYWPGSCPEGPRLLHPGSLELEGSRFLSEGVREFAGGPEGRGLQGQLGNRLESSHGELQGPGACPGTHHRHFVGARISIAGK